MVNNSWISVKWCSLTSIVGRRLEAHLRCEQPIGGVWLMPNLETCEIPEIPKIPSLIIITHGPPTFSDLGI